MLIEIITFEIRNFANGTAEQFAIANTPANFEMVSAHRKTREIQFTDVFDFEFVSKVNAPKFIRFGNAMMRAYDENAELEEMGIDPIDEMVGTY